MIWWVVILIILKTIQHELESSHNSVFASHVHMSLLAGNKVVFLNAMARLQNNVGEVNNNIVHKDRSALDDRPWP